MKIWLKPYKRKDGFTMIYVNGETKVSLGIAESIYITKLTQGQRNVLKAFWNSFKTAEPIIRDFKELKEHDEIKSVIADGSVTLYITDKAEVAGNSVGSDGAYLEYENNLYSISSLKGE